VKKRARIRIRLGSHLSLCAESCRSRTTFQSPYEEGFDPSTLHASLGLQVQVRILDINRGHPRLLRFNANKPFGEQDRSILNGSHSFGRSCNIMALAEENRQQILSDKSRAESCFYLTGREPVIRISTSLLALCCQSGLDATWETPIRARSRSNGSRSLRMSPLLIARFTKPSIAPWI
jgi:hypothetical protein